MEISLGLIRDFRYDSAVLSHDYYSRFRNVEIGTPFEQPRLIVKDLPPEVRGSLTVTGPVRIKEHLSNGIPAQRANREALVAASRSASRHVLNGGRDALYADVDKDEIALGYARVTDGDPCYFCAMLASRGPAYKTGRSAFYAEGGGKYHDGCGCTVEPVFKGSEWPGRAREYENLWKKAGGDINKFRKLIESSRPGGGS